MNVQTVHASCVPPSLKQRTGHKTRQCRRVWRRAIQDEVGVPGTAVASSSSNGDSGLKLSHIHVRFSVPKFCTFGRELYVVGNIDELGAWQVDASLKLTWNEGHLWTGETYVSRRVLRSLMTESGCLEYKYVVTGGGIEDEWMPGDNLMIPQIDGETMVVHAHDAWGIGYRQVKMEKLVSQDMKDMIQVEKRNSQETLQNLSNEAMEDLQDTLKYCEAVLESSSLSSEQLLDADRELAAASDRAIRMIQAREAVWRL